MKRWWITALLYVVHALCLSISATATPPIHWSPTSLSRTLIPSQIGVENVTFTPTANLTNIDLEVVPALSSVISVAPSHFSSLTAGVSVPVLVTFTVVGNPVPSLYNGVVQLRAGTTVLARPLPILVGIDVASARPPEQQSIVQDGFTRYPVNEIIVMLQAGSSLADANLFAASIGASVLGATLDVSVFQLQTPTTTPDQLNLYITALRARSEVLAVTRNVLSSPPATDLGNLFTYPAGPARTVAYDSIRLREVYDLARTAGVGSTISPRQVTVGLVDTGIQTDIIGTTNPLPEFIGVRLGNSCQTLNSCTDSELGGHGTEVAGIIGANNVSDVGPYIYPQMNGVLSGIPGFASYVLEERAGALSAAEQIPAVFSAVRSGARIVVLEIEIAKCSALSVFQQTACKLSPLLAPHCTSDADIQDSFKIWLTIFQLKSNVLFVLPAGNHNLMLPFVSVQDDAASVVTLIGGIDVNNAVTVAAFDPSQSQTSSLYRAVWGTLLGGICKASNFGNGVEIAAPGSQVYAPKPTDAAHVLPDDFYTVSDGTPNWSGTSAAAPFVAGVAGLVYALDPVLPLDASGDAIAQTPAYLKARLLTTADVLPQALGIRNRLNICRAVRNTLIPAGVQITAASPANGAVNVPINTQPISLTFSVPVEIGAIAPISFRTESGLVVNGSISMSADQRTINFYPASPLQLGTRYVADFASTRDICGDSFPLVMVYSFTTVAPPPRPPTATFFDGTFNDADWNETKILDTAGNASFSAFQVSSGGNPGAFRKTNHSLNQGSIGVAHVRSAFTYNPSAQGAITSIDVKYDLIEFAPLGGIEVVYGPLAFQNGTYYITVTDNLNQSGWTPFSHSGLTSNAFGSFNGSGSPTPDFSAKGGPIEFGFFSGNSPIGGPFNTSSGIDNLSITLHTQAPSAPPTCTLSANPTTITQGQSSSLTWTTTNSPTTASIDNGIGSVNPAGGTLALFPTVNTNYLLTVFNAVGAGTCEAFVTVNP